MDARTSFPRCQAPKEEANDPPGCAVHVSYTSELPGASPAGAFPAHSAWPGGAWLSNLFSARLAALEVECVPNITKDPVGGELGKWESKWLF